MTKDIRLGWFDLLWKKYPCRVGKKAALRHFLNSVEEPVEFALIEQALANYMKSQRVREGFIQNGSTWFNNWEDWIDPPESEKPARQIQMPKYVDKPPKEEDCVSHDDVKGLLKNLRSAR